MSLEDSLEVSPLFELSLNRQFFDRTMYFFDLLNDFLNHHQSELYDQGQWPEYDDDVIDWVTEFSEYKDLCKIDELLKDTELGFLRWDFEGDFPDIRIGKTYLLMGHEFFVSILIDHEWMTVNEITEREM